MLIEAAGLAIGGQPPTALLAVLIVISLSLVLAAVLAFSRGRSPHTASSAFNGWLRRNGRMILACTIVAAGLIVTTDGLVGLIKKG